MIRKNMMITSRHEDQLRREAEERQVSMSEILRKALDEYFRKRRGKE